MGKYELHDAAMQGNVEKVRQLLQEDSSRVDARGPKNRTPLHCAARGDRTEVVALLLSQNADVEARTAYKMTALHVACFYGSCKVTTLLIENVPGIDINAVDFGSWTPLHYACNYDRPECAKKLIEYGADLTRKSAELQFVALHLAARSGNLPIVDRLVTKGCDVNYRNLFFTTPLHLACQNDRVEVVQYLLKAGASPDASDEANITPMQLTRRADIVKTLETAIADRARQRQQQPNMQAPRS